MSTDDLPVTRRPEGESGKIIGCLTEANIEAIASIYALPEQVRRRKIGDDDRVVRHLAGRLGISPALVRRARRDRRVRKLRDQLLLEAVDDLWPTLVYRMIDEVLASPDPQKAFSVLAKAFGKGGDGGGVSVNVNSHNQTLTVNLNQDGGLAEDLENKLWIKEKMESGEFARLVGSVKEPVKADAEIVPPADG